MSMQPDKGKGHPAAKPSANPAAKPGANPAAKPGAKPGAAPAKTGTPMKPGVYSGVLFEAANRRPINSSVDSG